MSHESPKSGKVSEAQRLKWRIGFTESVRKGLEERGGREEMLRRLQDAENDLLASEGVARFEDLDPTSEHLDDVRFLRELARAVRRRPAE